MSDALYLFISVAVMAMVTYLIRMLPLSLFRKKIKSRFVLDFLYYVPYAVLAAMTIPGVFYSSKRYKRGSGISCRSGAGVFRARTAHGRRLRLRRSFPYGACNAAD